MHFSVNSTEIEVNCSIPFLYVSAFSKLSIANTLNYNKKKNNFGGLVGKKFTFQKFPAVYAILLEPPPRSQEKKFIKHLFVPSECEVLALL